MKLEGRTIGQIRIDELVGEGGMGAVYRGYDLRLERPVAVKTLHDRYLDDPVGRARFLREAQILSRLDHPGICKVYGIVRHEDADLLVLEWLEGASLGAVIRDAEPARLLDLAIDMADALAAAHRQQIVHRDLKPDNVIVTTDGLVKVLDFGIARSAEPDMRPSIDPMDEESFFFDESELDSTWTDGGPRLHKPKDEAESRLPALTKAGNTMGTIAYMSPEQVGGLPLGVASDSYSFGILLQEMFTGRRAYDPADPLHLMSLVVVGKTRPLGDLGPELKELIRALQALDEADRPSMKETTETLRAIREAPELRRRKTLHRAALATIAASLLLGLSAVIHGRIEAVRSAAEARELTGIAADAEWLMRAEHLAPPHDLRPARERVRRLMHDLEARSHGLDEGGRATGHLALGRAALALGEVDEAVEHLRQAWDGGLRDSSVAASYGLALAEQVRRRLVEADRQRSDAERTRLRQAASESRDLATQLLSVASRGEIEPSTAQLARAQLSFLGEDWSEALDTARQASETHAWFYEADLLAARTYRQRFLVRVHSGEHESAASDLRRALVSLDEAIAVGRSDPDVLLERCALTYDAYAVTNLAASANFGVGYEVGIQACRQALALDAENARGHLLTALLLARAAEFEEGERLEKLQESTESAQRAVELDPTNAEAWRAVAMGHMVRGDDLAMRGGDPEAALAAVIEASREGLKHAPRDVQLLNLVGNAEGARAEHFLAQGEDPMPGVERAVEAYLRAIEVGAESPGMVLSYPRTNLALQQELGVRWEAWSGIDPRPRAEDGLRQAHLALEGNEKNSYAWTAITEIASHVAGWCLDRGECEGAAPWVEQALDASTETLRWGTGSYETLAAARAHYQASRWRAAQGATASKPLASEKSSSELLQRSLELSRELTQDDPELVYGWVLRSQALCLASELSADRAEAKRLAREALEAADQALASDPQHVWAQKARDEALRMLENSQR